MKQIARITILMAAVLSLTACKPEPIEIERDITYTVSNGPLASSRQNTDNMTVTVHLTTDAEFDALWKEMVETCKSYGYDDVAAEKLEDIQKCFAYMDAND